MGCCGFGASPSMRIVASWCGSNGSTEYKDTAGLAGLFLAPRLCIQKFRSARRISVDARRDSLTLRTASRLNLIDVATCTAEQIGYIGAVDARPTMCSRSALLGFAAIGFLLGIS